MSVISESKNVPLAEYIWPRPAHPANMRVSVLVLFGVLLLTLSAKIQVPLWPVPMTFQTLVVLMIGLTYGRSLATATMLAYLVIGGLGLPVFAGTPERGIGLFYMFGPTGGFLFGFVISALVTSSFAERGFDRTVTGVALALLAGNAVIFGAGFGWLCLFTKLDAATAFQQGVQPFLIGNVIQSLFGLAILPLFWRRIKLRA